MTQDEIEEGKLEVERDKLKLAQDAHELERKKVEETLQLERKKAEDTRNSETKKSGLTSWSIVGSTVVAVLGLLVNGCLQRDIQHRTALDSL